MVRLLRTQFGEANRIMRKEHGCSLAVRPGISARAHEPSKIDVSALQLRMVEILTFHNLMVDVREYAPQALEMIGT